VNIPVSSVLRQGPLLNSRFGDRVVAISERKRSGIILCRPFYAEFVGPGAAIGNLSTQGYTLLVTIGDPDLVELSTPEALQRAYSRRIQWVQWLSKVVQQPDPIQRVEKLFTGFDAFFGSQVMVNLSDELLALLAGVLPHTVAQLRLRYQFQPISSTEVPLSCEWIGMPTPSSYPTSVSTSGLGAKSTHDLCGSIRLPRSA
jgi:hypothetical protein